MAQFVQTEEPLTYKLKVMYKLDNIACNSKIVISLVMCCGIFWRLIFLPSTSDAQGKEAQILQYLDRIFDTTSTSIYQWMALVTHSQLRNNNLSYR
jgi:hypothetical protein